MKIPSARYLKKKAGNRLKDAKNARAIVAVYAGSLAVCSLIINVVQYLLDSQISQTGGLQGIGMRSALTTANTVLPIVYALLSVCLALGYCAAMLRIARGQYVSVNTLRAGPERIWVLLRTKILEAVILMAMTIALLFLSINVYMMTPLATKFITALAPLMEEGTLSTDAVLAAADSALGTVLPFFIVYFAVLLVLLWYFFAVYRMVDYLLIEKPQLGAIGALRESRKLMRGNMMMMLRVDLSFWWYYLLQLVTSVLLYLDVVLALCGVSLPMSDTAVYILVVTLYLAANFAVQFFFSNRLGVTYALFYDSLCPRSAGSDNGAVLGNIFKA